MGWRPIFLLNLQVGGLALLAAARLVCESRAAGAQRLDIGGVALVALALVLIVYPIVEGRAWSGPAWVPALILAGLALLGLFVVDQRRKAARGAAPLVAPALFADRAFRVGLPTSLVFFAGVYSLFLALSVCPQVGFGHSPLVAALMIVPLWARCSSAGSRASPPAPSYGLSCSARPLPPRWASIWAPSCWRSACSRSLSITE